MADLVELLEKAGKFAGLFPLALVWLESLDPGDFQPERPFLFARNEEAKTLYAGRVERRDRCQFDAVVCGKKCYEWKLNLLPSICYGGKLGKIADTIVKAVSAKAEFVFLPVTAQANS